MHRLAALGPLLPSVLAGLAWPVAGLAQGEGGLAAVRSLLAQQGRVSVIAELVLPAGTQPAPAAVEQARADLARELAPVGVSEVRGLGSLPYVALEVDARQLGALLASGRVTSIGVNRRAGIHG